MTPFVYGSEVVFCTAMIAYLLAAFIGTVCFVMSISYRLKLQYVLPESVVAAASVLLFCYLSDGIRIRYFGVPPAEIGTSPCFLPTWIVLAAAAVLLAVAVFWLVRVVKQRLSGLTAMSVKEAIAELPVGLCFYGETGRLLLLNDQIAGDCRELTGESLYDGSAFWTDIAAGKVADGVTVTPQSEGSVIVERADGRVLLCKRIVHDMGGKTVYELCGTDISREFALKKEIEQKNAYLRSMNLRLKQYGEIVDEVTREREILAARIKVHGNLGSLILRTKKELTQGGYDSAALTRAWNDILSLILAPDSENEDRFAEADRTAASVGVRILYGGKRPESGTQAERIFAAAVSECVTNTARHADGTELQVRMTESETAYTATLTNNGRVPDREIREGGGLSSLRTMTEHAGGRMTVRSTPGFSLTVTVPKEEKTDAGSD